MPVPTLAQGFLVILLSAPGCELPVLPDLRFQYAVDNLTVLF